MARASRDNPAPTIDLDAIKKRHASEPREKWRRDAAVYASYRDVPALVAEVERLRRVLEYTERDNESLNTELDTSEAENARLRGVIEQVGAVVPTDVFEFDDVPEDVWRFVRDLLAILDSVNVDTPAAAERDA